VGERVKLARRRRRDVRRCAEIEKLLFATDDPWSAAAFHSELDSGAYYIGAYRDLGHGPTGDGELVGYAGLAVVGRKGDVEAEVHTIGVLPSEQGAGVGTALLRVLLIRADELDAPVFLEVRTDNEPAISLYEKHGFVQVGFRRRYYQPSGADAYTMRRPARSEVDEQVLR
jgi:[ribosomal protein S18]-alanine N-acetyltransferase